MKKIGIGFIVLLVLSVLVSGAAIFISIQNVRNQKASATNLQAQIDSMLIDSTTYQLFAREIIRLNNRADGIAAQSMQNAQFNNGVQSWVIQQMSLNTELDSVKTKKYFPDKKPEPNPAK